MYVINIATRTSSSLAFAILLLISSSANAFNRNDVFFELEKLNTRWDDISIDLWINNLEYDPEPGVKVGDRIFYNAKASNPAFFVFILVDAKGSTSIVKSDALAIDGITGASKSLTFPTIGEKKSEQTYIKQSEPLGKETIYLLVSDQRLPTSLFNLEALSYYVDYGSDLDKIRGLVTRLNGYSDIIKLAVHKYEYYVNSDTQYSTREIKRAVTERVQEVEEVSNTIMTSRIRKRAITINKLPAQSSPIIINDINFEYNSDVLNSTGISQLEILGSELIDRLAQNQLPDVLLTGHTDSLGSAEYNLNLSERRSISAKRFLVEELGLPGEYIDSIGMGESVPIDSNTTSSGRARNRRVEFVIMQ